MLVGLPAAAVLVGGLFFLTTLHQGISWRENLQDAADAAAYHTSVIQARGMNVLVAMNMMMAGVMAILVSFRMLQMLLLLAQGIALVISLIPVTAAFGAQLMARIGVWQVRLAQRDKPISEKVAKACAALNYAEKVTSTAVPPLAAIIASVDTSYDYRTLALGFSTSLVVPPSAEHLGVNADGRTPTGHSDSTTKQLIKEWYGLTKDSRGSGAYLKCELEECFQGFRKDAKPKSELCGRSPKKDDSKFEKTNWAKFKDVSKKRYEDAAQWRMGAPFSLPVMEDRIGRLCQEASKYQDFVFAFLIKAAWKTAGNRLHGQTPTPHEYGQTVSDSANESLDFISDSRFSTIKSKIVGAAPSLFCLPPTDGLMDLGNTARDNMEVIAKQACDNYVKEFDKKPEAQRKSDPFGDPETGKFDSSKCIGKTREQQKEQEDKVRDQQKAAREALDSVAECVRPAKVWELARNNNLFMVSWGLGIKHAPELYLECQKPPGVPKNPFRDCGFVANSGVITAQAEMQFKCNDTWLNCDPNAMWRWDWSAIPRKDVNIFEMAGDALALTAATSISHGLDRFLGNLMFKGSIKGKDSEGNPFKQDINGTDLKYGNAASGERELFQQLLYQTFPFSRTRDGNTNFH